VRAGREGGRAGHGPWGTRRVSAIPECANIARFDITEDVELGCKHRGPVGCPTHCGLSEGAD